LIAVRKVPESGELVFGVQRSSHLVVIPLADSGAVRRVVLTGGYGNAVPYVRATTTEVWAVDYDTLVRLDRRTWRVTVQSACRMPPEATRMFVGDLWWPPDEGFAIIPRPGNADVAVIDPATMTLTRAVSLGRAQYRHVMCHILHLRSPPSPAGTRPSGALGAQPAR
jgi:hypothetical protein